MQKTDVIVVGGGLVGMSIAFGLALLGRQVSVLDEGDDAIRAARGNFGLLWVQGKGYRMSPYAQWTRESVALWPRFAAALQADTGIDVHLRQQGGFQLCLSDVEMAEESHRLGWLRDAFAGDYPFELLDATQLRARLPGIGPDVVGGCFSPMDGHVNPLKLLRSLYAACQARGVKLINGHHVEAIDTGTKGFELRAGEQRWAARQVVLAAGLGNRTLGARVGLDVPVQPNRGQILVTERLEPFLQYPTTYVRQTDEGTLQLGDSHESTGFDDGTGSQVMAAIARRAVQCFPRLGQVRLVRAWGALRVMSADGFPIYEMPQGCPGLSIVSCHSGVTLAAAHALRLAPWIAGEFDDPAVKPFGLHRFNLQTEVRHVG
ncbi:MULTISPECIES: NAD(P)/FAD-dependent oxidoreductase [Pseudomonas]|uniref:Putative Opine oxidase subunit B n=2 Tax=Pseudomonas TaxID=286 RepID=F2KHK2_PSEBN|nr:MULTISPECIES: FAD-dependent oxidoreductase [Pseudomonas]AEA69288.1 putative Opine oxidase subunit B [Pseudomonas brassicacearum subsp. brassicacearum NFM421]KAB0525977.1 FAD-binding oxidoreductase [Pseudomonas brassicacearum subsp. brassicacearum]NJP62697.1 FAD-binding oxidoreductase [Pseudomonas brassicacearum]PJH89518.1 FAD-binding oxidoreductase [Pseudomonas sp. WCS365]QEO78951.1 FAD-binding oxidoreductase [Pseudomonas brassicacearum]